MWCDPIVVGYMPVMMPDRLGAQTPATVNAFVYRTPSAASVSSVGVTAFGWP
jgi:hypothetical protein